MQGAVTSDDAYPAGRTELLGRVPLSKRPSCQCTHSMEAICRASTRYRRIWVSSGETGICKHVEGQVLRGGAMSQIETVYSSPKYGIKGMESNRNPCAFDQEIRSTFPNPCNQFTPRSIGIGADRALPHDNDSPTSGDESADGLVVPILVEAKLLVPELGPCLWKAKVGTPHMSMPETTMYEYSHIPTRQHQIRSSGEMPWVDPVTQSRPPEVSADNQLRTGVLAADPRHQCRALVGAHYVNHIA